MATTFKPFSAPGAKTEKEDALVAEAETTAPDAAKDEAKPEKKKVEPRDYRVMRTYKGDAESLKAAIDELYKDGDEGEIFAVIAHSTAVNPKIALEKYGRGNEVDGKYVLAAERFLAEFNAKSEPVTKRKVTIS